ncbi:MAG: hypothetical protein J7485_13140 [Sphingobium sp.]|nr:hypothetical protein [Sphingobium sp.]
MPPPIASGEARGYRASMGSTILSLLMLAGIALTAGGIYLIGKKHDPKRGWLMIAAAVVVFGNVAIWAMPIG